MWHELCHVVTLAKTKNRMPRWLSEGISVYEERLRNAAWGQRMNGPYRELILAGQAAPVRAGIHPELEEVLGGIDKAVDLN